MKNFIEVGGSILTSAVFICDIDTNVSPVLVAAIAGSTVLNGTNTTPPNQGNTVWSSTESGAVVFAEIEKYLRHHVPGYRVTVPGKRFEW